MRLIGRPKPRFNLDSSRNDDFVIRRFLVLVIGLALGLGLPLVADAAQGGAFPPTLTQTKPDIAPTALFTSLGARAAGDTAVVRDVQVVRWRQVGIDRNLLTRSADLPPGLRADGRAILLDLFDDAKFVAEPDQVERTARGVKWVGRLRGVDLSQVIFTVTGDEVFGSISMPGRLFQLRHVGNGVHEVQEINTSLFSHDLPSLDRLAQGVGAQRSGQYYTASTVALADGTLVDGITINGPPSPPPGFEVERQAVSLPEPNIAAGVNTLTVPAFTWVFGCSSVSGAMIAGYYDRNGWSNMYTGPTNGGVMPLDNSSWPTWSDGYQTYPNLPLAASKNGVDGRTSRGSIDDYWVKYGSTSPDPYITGGWTQHTWGDAIGDYMKTSQSAFSNTDGSTRFWTYTTSPNQLTCDYMAAHSMSDDGTLGRELFYQARGYTVTDCYNQKTDNNVTGGFSFANFKAEIDAGRPVMLNLEGHTVAGVGYDTASNTVYIHDTWDYNNHTMTWGTSYSGMRLLSVSIVNLAGGTTKSITVTSPPAGANWTVGSTQTVSWTSTGSISAVEIWLWNNGAWTQLASNVANTGSKSLTVPNSPGTNCRIYVYEQANYSVSGVNPGAFSIVGGGTKSIQVTAPAAGTTWTVGSTQTVTWTSTGSISAVEIWLWNNGTYSQLANNVSNTGSKSITVPNSTGTNCWIAVYEQSNYSVVGWNPGAFSIVSSVTKTITVTSPPAGATWTVGSTQTVSWTSTGSISAVEIWLWNNGTYSQLANNVSNTGSKSITVPNSTGTNCWIAVYEQSNYSVVGWNPGAFSIVSGGGFNSQFNGDATNWYYLLGMPDWQVSSNYYYTYGSPGVFASTYYGSIYDSSTSYSNFDYQTKVWRYGSTSSNGIMVRGVPNPLGSTNRWNTGYGFYYSRDGYFALYRYNSGVATTLLGWTASSAINTGDAWNTLRAYATGTTIYFYINGSLVLTLNGTSLTSGKVGLITYIDNSSDSYWADWATLTTLSSSAAPAIGAAGSIEVDDSVPRGANSSDLGCGFESFALPPPKPTVEEKTIK